jgi:predicted AAA+ superfamily ATPase
MISLIDERHDLSCKAVDEWDRPGCFLILGSASRDLLKQSSESLAGRIVYKRLTPFLWQELGGKYPMENISQTALSLAVFWQTTIAFLWNGERALYLLFWDAIYYNGLVLRPLRCIVYGKCWRM